MPRQPLSSTRIRPPATSTIWMSRSGRWTTLARLRSGKPAKTNLMSEGNSFRCTWLTGAITFTALLGLVRQRKWRQNGEIGRIGREQYCADPYCAIRCAWRPTPWQSQPHLTIRRTAASLHSSYSVRWKPHKRHAPRRIKGPDHDARIFQAPARRLAHLCSFLDGHGGVRNRCADLGNVPARSRPVSKAGSRRGSTRKSELIVNEQPKAGGIDDASVAKWAADTLTACRVQAGGGDEGFGSALHKAHGPVAPAHLRSRPEHP